MASKEEIEKICPFCQCIFVQSKIKDHIETHLKQIAKGNKNEAFDEVDEEEEFLLSSEQRICPFCQDSFDRNEIKDHIGIAHLKPIILGKYDREDIKEPLLTSLGLNPKVVLEKLTPEELQGFNQNVATNQTLQNDEFSLEHEMRKLLGLDFSKDIKEEVDVTKFHCDKCDKIFYNKANLKRHSQSVHEGVRFTCEQCPASFSFHDALRSHMKHIHGGLRFACSECPKVFSYKNNLQNHVKAIHKGIQFECELCSKKFSTKGNLKAHVKELHEKVKYPCSQCSKVFSRKAEMLIHVKAIHDGVRYDCTICGKSYFDFRSLNRHKRIHHT